MKCIETAIAKMKGFTIDGVTAHGDEFTELIKMLSEEKANRAEVNDGSHELCDITMHLVYAAYQLATIYDLIGVRDININATYDRLRRIIELCHNDYEGMHHAYQMANAIAIHNRAFEDYLSKALPKAGMEETIPIAISSLCAGYSATMRIIHDNIHRFHIILGYTI